ncbi:MAG: helix-turn-helix domain-containing protein [Phycisphaerae bacterium]|nr:helix-turn-helix domain-containing protein [Phycisphaerae bacterium]
MNDSRFRGRNRHTVERASRQSVPAELADESAVGTLLGVSGRTVARMVDAGRLPAPVRIGRLKRWRLAEVRAWVAAGCPDAATFARLTGQDANAVPGARDAQGGQP